MNYWSNLGGDCRAAKAAARNDEFLTFRQSFSRFCLEYVIPDGRADAVTCVGGLVMVLHVITFNELGIPAAHGEVMGGVMGQVVGQVTQNESGENWVKPERRL